MSLEDFSRILGGKRPRDRDLLDRMAFSDEDGCSYDRQVAPGRLGWPLALALVAGSAAVAWASGDPAWDALLAKLAGIAAMIGAG
jgi:hypothetical protein